AAAAAASGDRRTSNGAARQIETLETSEAELAQSKLRRCVGPTCFTGDALRRSVLCRRSR
ncbi:MAG: hypothetical protein WD049_01965, partial [Candidatus Paceibacterota bacterium]